MDNNYQSNTWAMGCHLAALAFFVGVPFGNILGPLVVWLIKKDQYEIVDQQGKEALNFQISMTIYAIIGGALAFITTITLILAPIAFILWMMLVALALLDLVFIILATVKVSNGEAYRYPLTIRFIKE